MACTPENDIPDAIGCIDFPSLNVFTEPGPLIRNGYLLALGAAGLIFFAMLIFGGFRYMTAGGDEKAAADAQKTLTRAIIGLVIVVAAVLITQLLIAVFSLPGVEVTPPPVP